MEKEESNEMEMGKKEKAQAQKENEAQSGWIIKGFIPLFLLYLNPKITKQSQNPKPGAGNWF